MTHLCYTLEEAAEKLKLSETVLVRLSQYFKVPKAAYEEVGYLSFKGDLAFSEQDISFFRQAKERLLHGESLDEIRHRVREEMVPQPVQSAVVNDDADFSEDGISAQQLEPASTEAGTDPLGAPMREIQDRKPYEKAAEQSFERYKSMHRTGLGKVFENMLKEVGAVGGKKKLNVPGPGFRPLRKKFSKSQETIARHTVAERSELQPMPFVRDMLMESTEGSSWEHILQEATSQPRILNTQLKNAAQLLREHAIGKPQQEKGL